MASSLEPPLSPRPQSQNCLAVGTQAALLAGFAYSGLTQVAIPLDAEYVLKLLYLLVTTTAMCLELIAVMNTTLLSMMGPGLALRGPDGSMHPAVDGMMEEYQGAYLNFVLGLIAFHFSAAPFGWLLDERGLTTNKTNIETELVASEEALSRLNTYLEQSGMPSAMSP